LWFKKYLLEIKIFFFYNTIGHL